MGYQQVLRDTGTNLQVTFYSDEVLTDPDGQTATATITKADGTAIATAAATTRLSTGVYRYGLADQADLNYLTVVWQGTFGGLVQTVTDYVEIVGGFYVSVSEIRAMQNLADTNKFTTAALRAARAWFETKFEEATGVAWVPRYKRVVLNGRGNADLLLPVMRPRVIRSLRVYTSPTAYTAYTAAELADLGVHDYGALTRLYLGTFTAGNRNVIVEVEHGFDYPPPDVKEAALVAIRDKVIGDQTGNRVYAVQTQDGIIRNSTAGDGRPYGIPFCDDVATRRSHVVPGIA